MLSCDDIADPTSMVGDDSESEVPPIQSDTIGSSPEEATEGLSLENISTATSNVSEGVGEEKSGDDPLIETLAQAIDSTVAPVATSSTESNRLRCPPGVDESVWAQLPEEVQMEYLGSDYLTVTDPALMAETELDRDALAALPSAVRNEVLMEEASERTRRNSLDLTSRDASTGDSTGLGSDQNTNLATSSTATRSDNALFLSSLPPDLRHDVLISASEEFLRSLPAEAQNEARGLRERHAVREQMREGLFRFGRTDIWDPFDRAQPWSGAENVVLTQNSGASTGNTVVRARRPVGGVVLASTSTNNPAENPVEQNAPTLATTKINLSEDRLTNRPPYGRRMVTRIFTHLMLMKRPKCPRPILRLLASACRYRTGRYSVLVAMFTLLYRDLHKLTQALESIPMDRKLYYSPQIQSEYEQSAPYRHDEGAHHRAHSGAGSRIAPSSPVRASTADLSPRPTSSSTGHSASTIVRGVSEFREMFSAEIEFLRSQLEQRPPNSIHVRRLLNALSYVMRKTDRLVWYDLMVDWRRMRGARTRGEYNAVDPYSDPALSGWLFGQLIKFLEDVSELSSSVCLDLLLHVLVDLCEPLTHLTTIQANDLVMRQRLSNMEGRDEVKLELRDGVIDADGSKRKRLKVVSSGAGGGPDDDDDDEEKKSGDGDAIGDARAPDAEADRPVDHREFNDRALDGARGVASDIPVDPNRSTRVQDIVPSGDAGLEGELLPSTNMGSFDPSSSSVPELAYRARAESILTEEALRGSSEADIPFPVLDEELSNVLSTVTGSDSCGGALRNRMLRVMRSLALSDSNWHALLRALSREGENLARQAVTEIGVVHRTLHDVRRLQGDANVAMAQPLLSTPSSVAELRLLRILRIMTNLRATVATPELRVSKEAAAHHTDVASQYVRSINFMNLWNMLCDCLDVVRDLEGILETDQDHELTTDEQPYPEHSMSGDDLADKIFQDAGSSSHPPTDSLQPSVSSLTMRFMPLIECFLSVCSTTVLKLPPENTTGVEGATASPITAASAAPQSADRKRTRDGELVPSESGTGSVTREGPLSGHVAVAILGSRFRKNSEYRRMQMEFEDHPTSKQLLSFVLKNRVLLNVILRQNVYLLEGSFSPLAVVPRLRRLLHFDIKRAYFKMKLKRMKQSVGANARQYGSLRLTVHRNRVFEESFQKLRYCSAEEMRRKLSVTFHGEEGVDAGGLTREWYSVLAKEIFNANYCLFIPTIDNVTFQPYAHSHVNSHHLDYFKFIGRVIGKAICDGHLLDAHFTRSFYKHILGVPISYHDMEGIEPEYYRNLQSLLQQPLEELGLELTFSAELNEFGRLETVDLVENGRSILVTDENKLDYVRLISHHRMTTSIRKQVGGRTLLCFLSFVSSSLAIIYICNCFVSDGRILGGLS